MNNNWEYKPFQEVATSITPNVKIDKSEYLANGDIPIISQEEAYISGYWNNIEDITPHEKPVVIFGDHSRVLKYVDCDFVVGADGVKILQSLDGIMPKYLYHFLKWYDVPLLGYSRHFKLVKEASYPVPPIKVQEQIVAELDAINGLIDKNREVLRNLDALAQSIFYDTFGDPITNPKGFDKSEISKFCTVTSSSRIFAEEYTETGIPFYRGKEITELSKGLPISLELYISDERYNELVRNDNVPNVNDVLITAVGTIGNIWVVNTTNPFYFKDGNIIWLRNINFNILNSTYLRFSLTKLIESEKEKMANGSAYKALTIQNLKKLNILLPPLALQEAFAKKIEAIEEQKAKVEAATARLQTLLDSRMDYWFN